VLRGAAWPTRQNSRPPDLCGTHLAGLRDLRRRCGTVRPAGGV